MIFLVTALASTAAFGEQIIIKYQKPYAPLIKMIKAVGGRVTHQYQYVNAVAAEVPDAAVATLRAKLTPGAVRKDVTVNVPEIPRDRYGKSSIAEVVPDSVTALNAQDIQKIAKATPNAYLINNAYMNVNPIAAEGKFGAGMKVAVIDSGYRPGFPSLDLDGSVIGGEDLYGDGNGWSNWNNNGHGTFVAGMISANTNFGFADTSGLLKAVKKYCPGCVVDGNYVPMIGSAPLSSIYAVRVLSPAGSAPESIVLAGMERVIALREAFDNGTPEVRNPDGSYQALNIKVANMSLGGPTWFAGRDIEDEMTQAFQAHDIVLATSAGNAGPSGSTGGSPGTGFGSLTVGAASTPVHARIGYELVYGAGLGALIRPFGGIQTAYFSSRGPTADGRVDPDIVANGDWNYGQGFGSTVSTINLGSGTSFSSPSVAGVAALLRAAWPSATARQVRNALMMSANPAMITDGSGPLDQGHGFVDAAAALALLKTGTVPDTPGEAGQTYDLVADNIGAGAGIVTHTGNYMASVRNLLPGQRYEVYYRLPVNVDKIYITLSNVAPGAVQNLLFGDDIYLTVHSPKTSAFGEGDYLVAEYTKGGTYIIQKPDNGLLRVTVNGDYTNASPVSANLVIASTLEIQTGATAAGAIRNAQNIVVPFTVPAGAKQLSARLEWLHNWAAYPASDIDLILVRPDGTPNFDGATANSPERVELSAPPSGTWFAVIDGYTVFTPTDLFKLRVIGGRKSRPLITSAATRGQAERPSPRQLLFGEPQLFQLIKRLAGLKACRRELLTAILQRH